MADKELDYDDIISQNILIRKDENAADDEKPIVQVVTKDNGMKLNKAQRKAIIPIDENMSAYLESTLHANRSDDDDDEEQQQQEEEEETYYKQTARRSKHKLSEDEEDEDEDEYDSSDSDWERSRKAKNHKGSFKCDECDKKCTTQRGLMMHQRSHTRQRQKAKKTD